MILVNFCVSFLQTVDEGTGRAFHGWGWLIVEVSMEAIFGLEVCVRFIISPEKWWFFLGLFNAVDTVAAMPLLMRALLGPLFGTESGTYTMLRSVVPTLCLL